MSSWVVVTLFTATHFVLEGSAEGQSEESIKWKIKLHEVIHGSFSIYFLYINVNHFNS